MAMLTEEEEIELRAVFEDFDKDDNDKLDAKELIVAARHFGLNPSEEEVKNATSKHDINEDGMLSFDELKALIMDMYKSPQERMKETEEAMKIIFECEGFPDDGKLTKEEFRNVFQNYGNDPLTSEEVDEIFRDLDKDGDTETITKEEIAELFNS